MGLLNILYIDNSYKNISLLSIRLSERVNAEPNGQINEKSFGRKGEVLVNSISSGKENES